MDEKLRAALLDLAEFGWVAVDDRTMLEGVVANCDLPTDVELCGIGWIIRLGEREAHDPS